MNYVLYTQQTQTALSLILKMKELCQATYASTFNLLLLIVASFVLTNNYKVLITPHHNPQ